MARTPRPGRRKPTPRVAGRPVRKDGSGIEKSADTAAGTGSESATTPADATTTATDEPRGAQEAAKAAEATKTVESEKTSKPHEATETAETQTAETQTAESQKPAEAEKPEKPSESGKPAQSEKSTDAEKPVEADKAAEMDTSTARTAGTDKTDTTQADTSTGETSEADAEQKPAAKTRPVSRVATLRPSSESSTTGSDHRGAAAGKSRAALGGVALGSLVGRTSGKGRRGWRGLSTRVITILFGIALILGIIALIGGLHPGARIGDNKAFVDRSATTELTSQVHSKACALVTTTTDLKKWADSTKAVLTGDALKQFNQYLPQQMNILQQTKQVADCRVDSVGVSGLSGDGDGATARVVANMIVSQKASAAGGSAAPRYEFTMVKHGDDWLISKVQAF